MIAMSVIGRVIITQDRSASSEEFWCWIRADERVEVGMPLLVVDDQSRNEWLLVVVDKTENISTLRDVT